MTFETLHLAPLLWTLLERTTDFLQRLRIIQCPQVTWIDALYQRLQRAAQQLARTGFRQCR